MDDKEKIKYLKEKNEELFNAYKKKNRGYIIAQLCFVLASILAFYFFYNYQIETASKPNYDLIGVNYTVIDDCYYLDLSDSAECVRDQMSGFYNYTKNNDTYMLYSELVKDGADCKMWSELYKEYMTKLGFKTEVFAINEEDSGHAFAVSYDIDNYGYCILDQMYVECMMLN